MDKNFSFFEQVARNAIRFTSPRNNTVEANHAFQIRNIHPLLPKKVKELFDDGYYAEATFEAFKFIDTEVARLASKSETGFSLMMEVFNETSPLLKLTQCTTVTEKDIQKGFRHIFAGSIAAIRNPRGHKHSMNDTIDECLDHLALASVLLRQLEVGGFQLSTT